MGLFRANGQRVTRANVANAAADDPLVEVTEDLYEKRSYGRNDPKAEGSIHTLKMRAGQVMRESELDALFPGAQVESIAPAQGAAAGGTVVTIRGNYLDGVTAVRFDGANATNLQHTDDRELRVTTPAGAAGPADVVLVSDGPDANRPAAFTYQ